MATLPKPYLTPEEYLAIERKAEFKSEYVDGEMFAMSGVTIEHDTIVVNTQVLLAVQMRGRNCRVHSADLRVRTVPPHYCYPDLSAVCGKDQFLDGELDTLLNPTLIVEVLSRSTEAYDRGKKFERYQAVASLREYLLLASDRMHADLYIRQANGEWLLRPYSNPEGIVPIDSIGCLLKLADIYENLQF